RVLFRSLGGAKVAVDTAGTIHNSAGSEEEAFEQIRRFLSYMPSNVWELPPVVETADPVDRCDEKLATIVPEKRTQAYSMHRLVQMVIDRDSGFEIRPTYGKSVITMLARMCCCPVGSQAHLPHTYV